MTSFPTPPCLRSFPGLLLTVMSLGAAAAPPPQHEPPASLAAEGWYAGDLHIHRSPQEVETLAKQADLHIAPVITWWNETNAWKNLPPPKSPVSFDNGMRFYHLLSGEDERGGGALLYHNLAQPLDITGSQREWPSSVKFLRAAKAAGAWCEVEKPFWLDVPLWLASGLVDGVGICNNHIQIGGMMDNEAWGRARDREKYPGPYGNGLYTQDLYYRILNCGFRLPPTAGGASGVLQNPVGYNRVYVHCDAPLTWEKWWAGLTAGRAFVSNGPLLRVKAEGQGPGHVFKSASPLTVSLEGKLDSRDPVKSVELIVNGKAESISLPHRLEMKESGWFLVRAIADVPQTLRFASTAPWYVEIGGKAAPPQREDAQLFLDWTRQRAAAVEKAIPEDGKRAEVQADWKKAEAFWQALAGAPRTTGAHRTEANVPLELTFEARHTHADPFNEVTLDVTFTDPAGAVRRVPAFWAGGSTWKVRYASPLAGSHRWQSACSDTADGGMHGTGGIVEVAPYTGGNPLFQHGPVRVAETKRHFEHTDGTPFFWLGDTWWMGLCHRLKWPDEFQKLTADRKEKGFNVVQIVAGLYPDMHPFDPRGANEAGFPWEKEYARIRPEYFDAADARLRHLVDQGITPCLVGAWGYFLPWTGEAKMKAHWRYLIARYGAWPVIWCAAGEANLPWYLAKNFPYDDRTQVKGWTEVLRYIRATDPFRRPLTIHPTAIKRYTARHATDDAALLDFDMLQTPHGQREAVPVTVRAVRESVAAVPEMPVINGEAAYEMLFDRLPTEWTRAMFWLCQMNGAKGHTYGANGLWQLNRPGQPHGASPNGTGNGYGVITWEEAMRLPGSSHMALGKRFFESLPWTELKPMPDTVAWSNAADAGTRGDWIWFPEGDPKRDAPVAARYFRRTFEVPDMSKVRRALLNACADDRFSVWLNEKELGSGSDWHTPQHFDAVAALQQGVNVLAIRAENVRAPVALNPAGLSAALTIEFADGTKSTIATDAAWRAAQNESDHWKAAGFNDAAWPAALVTAKSGEGPWGPAGAEDPLAAPQACGAGDRVRALYMLQPRSVTVRSLKALTEYRATYFDPVTAARSTATVVTTAAGEAAFPPPSHGHDWVLLLE